MSHRAGTQELTSALKIHATGAGRQWEGIAAQDEETEEEELNDDEDALPEVRVCVCCVREGL